MISFADSLEHIAFPRAALHRARSLLNAGGALFISMPNRDAPLWRLMDDEGVNPYWGEIEHYHNFGLGRLRALLRECGFDSRHYSVSERYRACMELVAVLATFPRI